MSPSLAKRRDAAERPVLVAYDGSDPAKAAIRGTGRELRPGLSVLVLTVLDLPLDGRAAPLPPSFWEAGSLAEHVRNIAAEGAELARGEGFQAEPLVAHGGPTWMRIVETADEHDAELIVLGSRGRLATAVAVAQHTERTVVLVHEDGSTGSVGRAA